MPDIVYFLYVSNNNGLIEFYSFLLPPPILVIWFHPSNISFEKYRPNPLFSLSTHGSLVELVRNFQNCLLIPWARGHVLHTPWNKCWKRSFYEVF